MFTSTPPTLRRDIWRLCRRYVLLNRPLYLDDSYPEVRAARRLVEHQSFGADDGPDAPTRLTVGQWDHDLRVVCVAQLARCGPEYLIAHRVHWLLNTFGAVALLMLHAHDDLAVREQDAAYFRRRRVGNRLIAALALAA